MKSVAGGASGLIKVTWKQFGAGEERQLIPKYRVDTALSRGIRSTLKQVAEELGQWANQSQPELSGPLSMAEIVRGRRERREAAAVSADTAPPSLPSPLSERARAEGAGDRGRGLGISDGGCRPGQKKNWAQRE